MIAFVLTLLASLYLVAGIFLCARQKPGYSHIKHTISELGEVGSKQPFIVAFGLFFPVGLLLLVVGGITYFISPLVAGLAVASRLVI